MFDLQYVGVNGGFGVIAASQAYFSSVAAFGEKRPVQRRIDRHSIFSFVSMHLTIRLLVQVSNCPDLAQGR